eukprot:5547234-Prymnesium_polylepis.1
MAPLLQRVSQTGHRRPTCVKNAPSPQHHACPAARRRRRRRRPKDGSRREDGRWETGDGRREKKTGHNSDICLPLYTVRC